MTSRRNGLGWAYAGVALGGAVSVAANVAHSFVPPAGAPVGWRPLHGAVLAAVFWPVALFVAIEILARTAWPAGAAWRLVRLGGLLPVALVAAVVSYRHLSGLIRYYGEDGLTATVGPLAVDGLMAVASAALLAASSQSSPVAGATSAPPPAAVAPAATAARTTLDRGAVASPARPAAVGPAPDPVADAATPIRSTPELEAGTDNSGPSAGDPACFDGTRSQSEEARAFVRAELAAGRTPSGAAVGRRFGRNSRWGQRLVRDLLTDSDEPPADQQPAAPRRQDPADQSQHLAAQPTPDTRPSSPEPPPERSAEVHTKALQSDGRAQPVGGERW
jgi:hypothetical protein